jgi:hypothetical protein
MINILIGGGIGKFDQISQFVEDNTHIFDHIKLSVYDGPNNCKWNGGRINRNCFFKLDHLDFYADHNIDVKLVFTNNIIDLDDPVGNELLQAFHKQGNGVTLINDKLRSYIRYNYPEYKLTYSITGIDNINVPMKRSDVDKYKQLERDYDYIVPRAEHNLDPKMLLLNTNKYELYITEGCCTKCPVWTKHFESISEGNRNIDLFTNKIAKKYEDCWLERGSSEFDFDAHILDENQVMDLYRKGFKYFKLSGRDADHRPGTGSYIDYLDTIKQIHTRVLNDQ